ncbi:MAG: hypothetical protein KDI22_12840 [Gammaproteobacteria bacterium]|nr:hypothetical protein [Gammaproteobacteria bacterium]MCB1817533.1 hypothetical protein [Gammaproteobacteria bacterium]MCP5430819.1 hypothetical protein [Chromatiaceae bacterium]HOP17009.1 hypothetical protein [Gammaproteobacteria bacterium]HPQ26617.1 hypothetical protein [Gammaproteobacteria bacterium]
MNRSGVWVAACLLLASAVDAAPPQQAADGQWQLRISGHNSYLFGERDLGGGLRIPWEVVIQFVVQDGEYQAGSGRARWIDEVVPLSFPDAWFSCRQVDGTYLDSNLALHDTPRVRFPVFPVNGEIRNGLVQLQPGYEPPGNYLAITFACDTDNPLADAWFALAERGKQVMGKRQDAEKQRDGDRQRVRVREVAVLQPEARVEIPLQAGWTFAQGTQDDPHAFIYRLQRID